MLEPVNTNYETLQKNLTENCELNEVLCRDDEFPVHVFTGRIDSVAPRVCVSGRKLVWQ